MKCANCGGVIQGNSVACPHCGESLTDYRLDQEVNNHEDMTSLGSYDSEETKIQQDEWTDLDSPKYRSGRSDPQVYRFENRPFSSQPDNLQKDPALSEMYVPSSYTNRETSGNRTKSKSVLIISVLVIALILIMILLAVLFFRNRTPVLDSMTYQELITEYELSSDESDTVESAYHDRVRVDFENVHKSQSGYKATAVLYTPDMDSIYGKTVDEREVVNDVQRLSDNELESDRISVNIDQSENGLSESSARDLQRRIDQHFISIDEYVARSGSSDSTSSSNSTSPNNSTPSPDPKTSEMNDGSNGRNQTGQDVDPSPFYGIWCSGSKTESEAKAFIQQHPGLSQYNPQIFVTTQWSNLNSQKYYVVTAGTYSSKTEAESFLNSVQQSIPDAYVKYSGDWIG